MGTIFTAAGILRIARRLADRDWQELGNEMDAKKQANNDYETETAAEAQ
jgi:hypothetical protein